MNLEDTGGRQGIQCGFLDDNCMDLIWGCSLVVSVLLRVLVTVLLMKGKGRNSQRKELSLESSWFDYYHSDPFSFASQSGGRCVCSVEVGRTSAQQRVESIAIYLGKRESRTARSRDGSFSLFVLQLCPCNPHLFCYAPTQRNITPRPFTYSLKKRLNHELLPHHGENSTTS